MSASERIRLWVDREFNAKWADLMFRDLIDVIEGNRDANRFQSEALRQIFPEWPADAEVICSRCDAPYSPTMGCDCSC